MRSPENSMLVWALLEAEVFEQGGGRLRNPAIAPLPMQLVLELRKGGALAPDKRVAFAAAELPMQFIAESDVAPQFILHVADFRPAQGRTSSRPVPNTEHDVLGAFAMNAQADFQSASRQEIDEARHDRYTHRSNADPQLSLDAGAPLLQRGLRLADGGRERRSLAPSSLSGVTP